MLFACVCVLNCVFIFSHLSPGILSNETGVPDAVQCKLVAVGVFRLLSCINVVMYIVLVPAVVFSALQPFIEHQRARFLHPYRLLPAFGHALDLEPNGRRYDDLSIYLMFLEENLSELKSYKCLQVSGFHYIHLCDLFVMTFFRSRVFFWCGYAGIKAAFRGRRCSV